jgi:hypothetical protein
MGSGMAKMVKITSVSGKMTRQMALEFILGKMGTNTKVNGQLVLEMGKAQILSRMEINI